MRAKIIYRDASVRRGPSITTEGIDTIQVGTIIEYSEVIIQQPGSKEWLKLQGGDFHGRYIQSLFPDKLGYPIPRVEFLDLSEPPDPPEPPEPKINFAVVNYTDETGTHEVTLFPR